MSDISELPQGYRLVNVDKREVTGTRDSLGSALMDLGQTTALAFIAADHYNRPRVTYCVIAPDGTVYSCDIVKTQQWSAESLGLT